MGVNRSLVIAFLLIAGASGGCVWAQSDIATPPATDPVEHAALMELGAAARGVQTGHFDPQLVTRLESMIARKGQWGHLPEAELALARAKARNGDTESALLAAARLRDTYQESRPSLAAWAQYYTARFLEREKRYQEAALACSRIEAYWGRLEEPQPVLQARRKLAMLLRTGKVDASRVFSPNQPDAGLRSWEHSVLSSLHAERGKLQDACLECDQAVAELPSGDRRRALAVARLACSLAGACEDRREPRPDLLNGAKAALAKLETGYPNEKWLLSRTRTALASAMANYPAELQEAQRYCRLAIDQGAGFEHLPQAYSLLALCSVQLGDYDEAKAAAHAVVTRYPYSSWADYAQWLYGRALAESGDKQQADAAFDDLSRLYPESPWARIPRAGGLK